MNKQQLANKIWESANKMRSKIEANEYKDYILGFIFYKFLSDKQVRFMQGKGATAEEIAQLSEDDAETVKYIQSNIGYFIAYKDLFSTWLAIGKSFDVSNVRDALSAFDRLIDPPPFRFQSGHPMLDNKDYEESIKNNRCRAKRDRHLAQQGVFCPCHSKSFGA